MKRVLVILAGLKKDLRGGDCIGVILHFKNHEDIIFEVSVQDAAPDEDQYHSFTGTFPRSASSGRKI